MGREIRRVPLDWQHPRYTEEDMAARPYIRNWTSPRYKPLFEGTGLKRSTEEWDAGFKEWCAGERLTVEKDDPDLAAKYEGLSDLDSYNEYHGEKPNPSDYTPAWTPEEAVGYQVYETVSEGTPVSPVFKTTDEIIAWLTGPRGGPDDPWDNCGQTLEAAKKFLEWGSAPSMVIVRGGSDAGIYMGVAACAAHATPVPPEPPVLNWNSEGIETMGTSLQGYLTPVPWTFEETVARLVTLTGQKAQSSDRYKISVEFIGTFHGRPFTLYDYKSGGNIHIGGDHNLDVAGLRDELIEALGQVQPTPYEARLYYESRGSHRWPPVK